MGLTSAAARGRVARRAAVAGLAALAVVYAGTHGGGPSRPMPDALAAQRTAPTSAISALAWHANAGAAHSPTVERALAGRAGALRAAARTAVPAGDALGLDVSSFDHPGGAAIGWAKVAAAGYRFAFIKVTEGSYYDNPYYASDAAAARAAGLFTAAYHFAIPNNSPGALQADLALDAAGDPAAGGVSLPLILDAEYDPYVSLDGTNECYGLSPAAMTAWISAFAAEVIRRTGQPPAIYTTSDWWAACTGNSAAFGTDPLWIATSGKPAPVPGWAAYTYWQFTSAATVPGIGVKTDASYFSPATLAAAEPAGQSDQGGAAVTLPIRSLAAAAGNAISYTAAGLPPGLAADPKTGIISGTLPGAPASYPVTVTLAGPAAQTRTLAFIWQVHGHTRLTWPGRQSGRSGSPVSLQLSAPDGLPGCSLRFTATGLPPGLAISPCGRITGIPYRPGSYQPTVTAGDSASPALASTAIRWTIAPARVAATGKIGLALGRAGKCLAARAGSPAPVAEVWACGKSPGQAWTLTQSGSIEQGSKCLAAITLPDGTPAVALRSCTSRMAQIWQQTALGGLASAQTGQCLTEPDLGPANGTTVTLAGCAGLGRQAWTLPPGPLSPALPGQCLTKVPATASQPAQARLTRCLHASDQNWTLTPAGTITFARLCLDTGPSPAPGTPVTLTACSDEPSQDWQPLPALATTPTTSASATGTTGTFLINPATGLCLNTPATTTAPPLTLTYCAISYPRQTWHTS